jgi:hypothetical protein
VGFGGRRRTWAAARSAPQGGRGIRGVERPDRGGGQPRGVPRRAAGPGGLVHPAPRRIPTRPRARPPPDCGVHARDGRRRGVPHRERHHARDHRAAYRREAPQAGDLVRRRPPGRAHSRRGRVADQGRQSYRRDNAGPARAPGRDRHPARPRARHRAVHGRVSRSASVRICALRQRSGRRGDTGRATPDERSGYRCPLRAVA